MSDATEAEPAIPVSVLLRWIENSWPEGSGSDFNRGVVRGFEIIKAQLEGGHIHAFVANDPQARTPSPMPEAEIENEGTR